MDKTPFLIVGTGPIAREALEITDKLEVLVYGFISEEKSLESEINDVPVVTYLGSEEANSLLADEKTQVVVAESDIERRQNMVEAVGRLRKNFAVLRHPSALISAHTAIGPGNIFLPNTVVGPNVVIADHNLIETGVTLGTSAEIGNYCTLQTGVHVGRGVVIEDEVVVGMGAKLYPGITIGRKAMIAPGAVVLKSVEEKGSAR